MKRIEEIKQKREQAFWALRKKYAAKKKIYDIHRELEKNVTLISESRVKDRVLDKINLKEEEKVKKNLEIRN